MTLFDDKSILCYDFSIFLDQCTIQSFACLFSYSLIDFLVPEFCVKPMVENVVYCIQLVQKVYFSFANVISLLCYLSVQLSINLGNICKQSQYAKFVLTVHFMKMICQHNFVSSSSIGMPTVNVAVSLYKFLKSM